MAANTLPPLVNRRLSGALVCAEYPIVDDDLFSPSVVPYEPMTGTKPFAATIWRAGGRCAGDAFAVLLRDNAAQRLYAAGTAFGFVNGVADLTHHRGLRRVTVETENGPASIMAPALGPYPAGVTA